MCFWNLLLLKVMQHRPNYLLESMIEFVKIPAKGWISQRSEDHLSTQMLEIILYHSTKNFDDKIFTV